MLLLDHDKDSFALLGNQAGDYLLGNVLCRIVEQFLELHARESANHVLFAADGRRVLAVKLVKLVFLFKHVFYESAPPICHLTETISESSVELISRGTVGLLTIDVGHVPHIMRDKFLHPT